MNAHPKLRGALVLILIFSIAGLTVARVCHDHFEDVVIIEPETWLNSADAKRPDSWNQENKRSRVMQYESFHGLLSLRMIFLATNDPLTSSIVDYRLHHDEEALS